MKVCIVFIATNKYNLFFDRFYLSINQFFLPESQKTFLVFSDMDLGIAPDIKCYNIQHEKWPFITLKRFHFIEKAFDEIAKNQALIFIDADMYAVKQVSEAQFFQHQKIFFGVQHPMYDASNGTYEHNPKSTAYLNPSAPRNTYYQGCMWGGSVPQVMNMISFLRKNIDEDLKNGIVARWHDESHLNKFFADNYQNVFTYDTGFCYPECMKGMLPFEPKFMHIDKSIKEFPRFEGV